jgi:hypothetical protein
MNFFQEIQRTRQEILKKENRIRGSVTTENKENSPFKIKGNLEITAIYPNGKKEKIVDEKNLVVKQSEIVMAQMSAGLRQFSYIELGDPDPAQAPDLADTTLQQSTGQSKAVTGTINSNSVILEATWGVDDGNGYDYTEAGVFTSPFLTGLLFARKTFGKITKTNAFSLQFTWTIVFQINNSGQSGCSGVSIVGRDTICYDYFYEATGGETELVIPIDFTPGTKNLDVFLNGQRLAYNKNYYESVLTGTSKGIKFMGFSLNPDNEIYVVNRELM